MKNLIVGNWKMNLTIGQSLLLSERLKNNLKNPTSDIVVCPNYVSLAAVSIDLKDSIIKVGAQNINANDERAYTGEVSGPMLKGIAKYVIVGHSERRIHFGETNKTVALKVAAAVRNKLTPILCVGENLHQRNEGLAGRTVTDQLEENLSELTHKEISKIVIAYEPVWAIGTGENAEPFEVEKMIKTIRRFLINKYKAKIVVSIKLLYGGSVNSDNANAYLSIDNCNGLLVGGASLNYRQFTKICQL
ncbi:triosephosphate isomerase [Candidatus Saccharibacteria bacterium]|nr:triosephosphate isomerase [Candidatus Saccharibacteria bacterium]